MKDPPDVAHKAADQALHALGAQPVGRDCRDFLCRKTLAIVEPKNVPITNITFEGVVHSSDQNVRFNIFLCIYCLGQLFQLIGSPSGSVLTPLVGVLGFEVIEGHICGDSFEIGTSGFVAILWNSAEDLRSTGTHLAPNLLDGIVDVAITGPFPPSGHTVRDTLKKRL